MPPIMDGISEKTGCTVKSALAELRRTTGGLQTVLFTRPALKPLRHKGLRFQECVSTTFPTSKRVTNVHKRLHSTRPKTSFLRHAGNQKSGKIYILTKVRILCNRWNLRLLCLVQMVLVDQQQCSCILLCI